MQIRHASSMGRYCQARLTTGLVTSEKKSEFEYRFIEQHNVMGTLTNRISETVGS